MSGRILSFGLLTVGGGLLQLWVLYLMAIATGTAPTLGELLGDGGLYFFATSLSFSSFVSLSSSTPIKFGTNHFNVTILLVGPVTLLAVVMYISVLSGAVGQQASPFSNHILSQLGCTFASLVYGLYVGVVTGFFEPL